MRRTVFLLLIAGLGAASAAARISLEEGGAWIGARRWDLGAKPAETIGGLWGDVRLGPRLTSHMEVSSARIASDGVVLGPGEGVTGAALLRYEPDQEGYLLQVGIGLPTGGSGLTAEELSLARLVGEPVLSAADPDRVRGWRLHLGAMGGYPVTRRHSLFGGLGYEAATAFEPAGGTERDPSNRVIGLLGIEDPTPGRSWGADVGIALEGKEKGDGDVIRRARTLVSGRLRGRFDLGGLAVGLSAATRTGTEIEWLSAAQVASLESSGPGRQHDLSLSVAARHPPRRWQPVLTWAYRRYQPAGLPQGDGWLAEVGPSLTWVRGPRVEMAVTLAWRWGRWRPWVRDGYAAPIAIDGLRLHVELNYRAR